MIKLTKLTDYAVVLLAYMAAHPDWHKAAILAKDSGLPAASVAKLLKKLAKSGLLLTKQGAQGGYRLARAPHSITVAEMIVALDGPIALTDCAESQGSCGLESLCGFRGRWDQVNRAVRLALETITLADMLRTPTYARPAAPSIANSAQIGNQIGNQIGKMS